MSKIVSDNSLVTNLELNNAQMTNLNNLNSKTFFSVNSLTTSDQLNVESNYKEFVDFNFPHNSTIKNLDSRNQP